MSFRSVNPINNRLLKTYDAITTHEIKDAIGKTFNSYKYMRNSGPEAL